MVFNGGGASSTDAGEDVNGSCSGASARRRVVAPLCSDPQKRVKTRATERGKRTKQAERLQVHLRRRNRPANGGVRRSSSRDVLCPNRGVRQRGRSRSGVLGSSRAWARPRRLGRAQGGQVLEFDSGSRSGARVRLRVWSTRGRRVGRGAHGQWLEARWIGRGSGASDAAAYRFAGSGLRRRELGRGVGWLAG